MSEQRAGDGTDGDTLARLEEQVAALRDEVRRLGASAALPRAAVLDEPPPVTPAAYAWLGALEPPVRRRPQVPRLLLEGLFLAAAATVAAVAELDAVAIAGVMIGAWVLVALIEWAASRAERRPEPALYRPAGAVAARRRTRRGSAPRSSRRCSTSATDDNVTEVTRLPPVEDEVEATAERRPWR